MHVPSVRKSECFKRIQFSKRISKHYETHRIFVSNRNGSTYGTTNFACFFRKGLGVSSVFV